MFWVWMHCGTYTVDVVPSHVGCWWMLDARAQGTYEVVKNFLQDYWGTLALPWGFRTTAIWCVLCHRWQVRRCRTESIRNGWIAEKFVRLHLSSPAAAGMIHLLIHYDSLWFTLIHWLLYLVLYLVKFHSFRFQMSGFYECPVATSIELFGLDANANRRAEKGRRGRDVWTGDAGNPRKKPLQWQKFMQTSLTIIDYHWISPFQYFPSIFPLQNDVFQQLASMSSGRKNFQHLSTYRMHHVSTLWIRVSQHLKGRAPCGMLTDLAPGIGRRRQRISIVSWVSHGDANKT